jgi:hypothetical protein
LTAQFVANRTERRKAQTLEIRHPNAATNLIVVPSSCRARPQKAAAIVRNSFDKPLPAMSSPRSSKWSFTPLDTATAPRVDHDKLTNEFFFVVCHHRCHSSDGYRRQLRLEHP